MPPFATRIVLTGFIPRLCGSAAALACAASLSAQQTPPQLPRPTFSASVDIVSVDVNVIDRNGRPVRDLAAADFTLTVDGRPRKIASAQFVPVTAPDKAAAPPPAHYTSNLSAANGRLIVIVVDRGSIAPLRSKDVLAAAARFVERLAPSDRVALFSIPSGPAVDFTTDHDAVVAALLRTDGQANPGPGTKNIGIAEAIGFERGNRIVMETAIERECGGVPGRAGGNSEVLTCMKLVTEEAGIVAAYARERAQNTVAGLRAILERFGAGDTPKTLVLISEGLVIDGERFAATGLARALAAAHATIYALKPEPSDADASQQRAPQNRARDRAVYEDGLITVTRAGGGDMFRVIADPDFAFARLSAELSGYYLLGFEPEPADRDGKEHSIQVSVARPDVAIRSRPQFTFGAAGKTTQQVITELLRTPVAVGELPMRLTTYAFQDPDTPKVRLLVAMEIDRSDGATGAMALGMVMVKAGGEVGTTFYQPSIGAPDRPDPHGQRAFATLLVDPGQYTLKAAVVDKDGRRGSLERPVRAFMTRMSRFRATELLIGDDTSGGTGAGSVVPTITGDLSGDQLFTYLELFADSAAAFEGTSVSIEVVPAGGTQAVGRAAATLQPVEEGQPVRAVSGAVPIALLTPGPYTARAVVSVDGKTVGQMTRPFRVAR
ncbi:MAG TPA: VWA domain-containing protein [Vicinamibacterales bacterium]|nr:VWA domain-containing protein [Vicinamibacterales bacterium]